MLSQRQDFLTEQGKYKAMITDAKGFMSKELYADSSTRWKELSDAAKGIVKRVDDEISNLIKTDSRLMRPCELLTSIPGVGNITAWHVISSTEGFTKF